MQKTGEAPPTGTAPKSTPAAAPLLLLPPALACCADPFCEDAPFGPSLKNSAGDPNAAALSHACTCALSADLCPEVGAAAADGGAGDATDN